MINVKKIPVLDADIYSHEALSPNQDATRQVIHRYGKKVFKEINGIRQINRFALGEIIFSCKSEKYWLEKLLHPIINKKMAEEINKYINMPTIAMIIPLLYEANLTSLCNETWIVYCTLSQQYERLTLRSKLTFDQAKARIKSQLSLEEKKHLADQIIDNSKEFGVCFKQIDALL